MEPPKDVERVIAESFDAEVQAMVKAGMPVRSEAHIGGADFREAMRKLEAKQNGKAGPA